MMFRLAVVAFFGLVTQAAGNEEASQLPYGGGDGEIVRLPFDGTFKCLNSSAVEEHWLTSESDLQAELTAELEAFLYQNLPLNSFLYLEDVTVTLNKYEQATDENEGSRSFLRQSDYMASDCDLDLKLSGNAMFKVGSMDQTLSSTVPDDQSATPRSDIYSQVAEAVVEQYNIIIYSDASLTWSAIEAASTPPPTPPNTPTTPPLPTPAPPTSEPTPTISSALSCLAPVNGVVSMFKENFFCSPNGKFKFGLAKNGDLALFDGNDDEVWSANTCCTGKEVKARLQKDGNLVVSSLMKGERKVLWASHSETQDLTEASLIVGDDGIVTITDTLRGHIWSTAIENKDRVNTDSLVGKVMAGYQGWFHAPNDGGMNRWFHWSRPFDVPGPNTVTFDAWPDLREFDDDELYPTSFVYEDGSNAGLYSAHNAKTVERHTRWMKDYGMHGVFAQRFIGNTYGNPLRTRVIDTVLGHVRSGAEKYGRTFVNMYDISNGKEATIVDDIINDWKHLVDDEHITKSKQYLHHRGLPLVAIWGWGFHNRISTPQQAKDVIDWFHNANGTTPVKYRATVMGGVPTGWRLLVLDSKIDPAWADVYRSLDVISPWAVGRFRDISSFQSYHARVTVPDLAECENLGKDYFPVVYPGFSFTNLKPEKAFNGIPRNGGTFMWQQMYSAVAAGSKMLYVAMFDETDEGTAIFKIAENQQQTPTEGQFVAADQDVGYENCPGDWYLNITGIVAGLVQDGKAVPPDMPAYP